MTHIVHFLIGIYPGQVIDGCRGLGECPGNCPRGKMSRGNIQGANVPNPLRGSCLSWSMQSNPQLPLLTLNWAGPPSRSIYPFHEI